MNARLHLPTLPKPQPQVAVAGYHDGVLKDALEDYYDTEQMEAYALAAVALHQRGVWGYVRRWWMTATQWEQRDQWTRVCRICRAVDSGYSYGHPDTAIYFDRRCDCPTGE